MTWEIVQLRLLEVGEKIFREQGFNGTGIQQITDAADVPKGSFYNHFPSKEAFAVEVLNHHWASHLVHAQLGASGDPAGQHTRGHIKAYFLAMRDECIADDFHSGSLLGNIAAEMSGQNEAIRITVEAIFAHWSECLAKAISSGQHTGELTTDVAADLLAATLLDAWHGAVLRAALDRHALPFERFFTFIFDPLLH